MRKRTQARECALQILYQIDITGESPEEVCANFWRYQEDESIEGATQDFAVALVKGVVEHLDSIDEKIAKYATNWQLKRMAVVDRNILRLSSFEILFREDIPVKVSINEAVDLAKKFSGEEAGKFVNGILDKVKLEKKP